MKRILTLLTIMLCVIGQAWAGDVFTISYNGEDVQSTANYFSHVGGHNLNGKFIGTYEGTTYKAGLKLESSTFVSFTSKAKATVTIVQSLNYGGNKYVKFDDTQLTEADRVDNTADNVGVYTLTDVEAGDHKIGRGTGEAGLLFVKVEYTGSVMTQLAPPTINYDETTGMVTIIPDVAGQIIHYTINGTAPTDENALKYTEPFVVTDGTVVKAVAVGDGITTITSGISEKQVLLTGIVLSEPLINQYNGTVAIMCENPAVTIEYSKDNGATWNVYTGSFTIVEGAEIKAKVSRDGCISAESSAAIAAVPANNKTKTIYMGWGSFNLTKTDNVSQYSTLNGKEGDDAYGYSLILNNIQKDWSQDGSGKKITCPIGERTGIKVSNGAQNILRLPEGVKATRLTIYSYVNRAETGSRTSGWREVNGSVIPFADVPMSMFSDNDMRFSDPDVRIFPLDNVTGEITFTNTGEQVCFILALDVLETVQLTTADTEFYSLYLDYNAAIPAGITAYTGQLSADETKLTVQPVAGSVLPAGTAVLVKSDAPGTFAFESTTATAAVGENSLKGVAADTDLTVLAETGKQVLTLGMKNGQIGFRRPADTKIKANRAYLLVSETSPVKVSIMMADPTGISEIGNDCTGGTPACYNLAGQRVEAKAKELIIKNGKKHIAK